MGAELHRLPDTSAPPAGVELRPASGRLLDAAFDVYAACGWFDEPGDRERRTAIARTLRDGEVRLRRTVALRNDRPIGAVTAFVTGDVLLLHELAVVEDERRRGIGRALVLGAVTEARSFGCQVAVLAPTPDGRKLAEALGFDVTPTPGDRWFYLPFEPPRANRAESEVKTETLRAA
jgi:GNAT superfamily N-acetyltransferase